MIHWHSPAQPPSAFEEHRGPWRPGAPEGPGRTVSEQVQATPEFAQLRRRVRGFAFPVTAAFLLWYLAFVLLASYARDLMATPLLGAINLGLVIGLLQFVSTFLVAILTVRHARRRIDPLADSIRVRIERDEL